MKADDPRHGTYAGALAHHRLNFPMCGSCILAQRRHHKRAKMRLAHGVKNRIPLGDAAWKILTDSGCTRVAQMTGLNRNNLYRAQRGGPDIMVLRSTRDAILRVQPPTAVGIQRRLQALTHIGYSMAEVAAIAGCHFEPLLRIRRGSSPQVVKTHIAVGVVAAYDQLCMIPKVGRHATVQRNRALRNEWRSPLAWESIDTDVAPTGIRDGDRRDLLADWADLKEGGESIERAAERLGVTVGAIERAEARAKEKEAAA